MRKTYVTAAVAVVVILVTASIILLASIPEEGAAVTPLDDPALPARGFFMGVLPTPYDGQSFEDAYEQASEHSEFVPVWGRPSPFYDMTEDLSGSWGDTFVTDYTRGTGMFPLIHFSFYSTGMTLAKPPGMEGATLSDPVWREAYKQAIVDTVREIRPLYLSVGNEVNRWYEHHGADSEDPNGFQNFVTLYEEVYDAVKALSNETKVFCVFSREVVSEYREADIDVLDMFDPDKMDLLVFTSYAFAVQGVNCPDDLPDDYYSRALAHMPGKMMGFSELGWPSIDAFGGEQGQADFLSDVVGRLTTGMGVDLHMLAWAWLHDLDAEDESGLIELDGTPKLAYDTWMDISDGP